MNSEKKNVGDAPIPEPAQVGGKDREAEISELRTRIEKSAEKIKYYYSGDIIELHDDDYKDATAIVSQLVKEHDIHLYDSYLADAPICVFDVLKSNNMTEFITNLEKYASEMEEWAKIEEDYFYNVELRKYYIAGNINDIKNAKYIVKVHKSNPKWGLSQLRAVILCKDKKEAKKVSKVIWRRWGDFGIAGANVHTEIKEVSQNTAEEIKKEYGNDVIQYFNEWHEIRLLLILDAKKLLDIDE
jgi:hypothetical protein